MDIDQNWLRAEDRMARNQRLAGASVLESVRAILREHFQHGSRHDIPQVHAAFDLRLHDVPVDGVAQVGTGDEMARIFENSRHSKYLIGCSSPFYYMAILPYLRRRWKDAEAMFVGE